jgi:hypothetical protein
LEWAELVADDVPALIDEARVRVAEMAKHNGIRGVPKKPVWVRFDVEDLERLVVLVREYQQAQLVASIERLGFALPSCRDVSGRRGFVRPLLLIGFASCGMGAVVYVMTRRWWAAIAAALVYGAAVACIWRRGERAEEGSL